MARQRAAVEPVGVGVAVAAWRKDLEAAEAVEEERDLYFAVALAETAMADRGAYGAKVGVGAECRLAVVGRLGRGAHPADLVTAGRVEVVHC